MTDEAKAARDEGMAKVETPMAQPWMALATIALHRTACRFEMLTTDDVWAELREHGIDGPSEPRALGPVMMRGARQGWVTATREVRLSKRTVAHAGPKRLWASNVLGEPPLPWPGVVVLPPVVTGDPTFTIGTKDDPDAYREHVWHVAITTGSLYPEPSTAPVGIRVAVIEPGEPKGWSCGCHRTAEGRFDKRCVKHTWADPQ